MKYNVLLLDVFVFSLVLAEGGTKVQDDNIRPSLVHLFRARRFDFSMFGCSYCKPVMECTSDHTCQSNKGHGYTCEFKCCTFVCVKRGSDRRTGSLGHDSVNDETFDEQFENMLDISVDVLEEHEGVIDKQNLSNTSGETEGLPTTESTNRKLDLD